MDKTQLVEKMAQHFYDEYHEKCKNLTDSELQAINIKNSRIVGSTPLDTNNFEAISRCYAEGIICKKILEERKNYAEEVINWEEGLLERKEKAVLNLPTAVSKHGQLVAAILEFKGEATLKEICNSVKEYDDIDDSEIIKIVEGLEKEEIIYKTGGANEKYRILSICTSSLFPENVMDFAKNAYRKNNKKLEEGHIAILKLINDTKAPVLEKTFCEKTTLTKFQADDILFELERNGVLKGTYLGNAGYAYYFKMLGERRR